MKEIRIECRDRHESDEWVKSGKKITSSSNLKLIKETLEKVGPIIINHWYFRGGSCPRVVAFNEFEDFVEYIQENASGGDIIDVWSFYDVCNLKNTLLGGKIPDIDGKIPKKGAY